MQLDYFRYALILYLLLFPMRLVLLTSLERTYIAHAFTLRSVITMNLITMLFSIGVTFPISQYISNHIGVTVPVPHNIDVIPLPVRIGLYMVAADFGHYWIHRLMHTTWVWPVHRWHHSPSHMSWAAGVRATFIDASLVNLAYVFAWPLLGSVSMRLALFLTVFSVLKNDWMHLNVRWRLPLLERVIVTPRYHHLHHSTDPLHFNTNFGTIFSFWDRLFGTFSDPALTPVSLRFGLMEDVSRLRLFLGV